MTAFKQKVYNAVKKIPRGEPRTYKEIARAIGNPKAYRAVGNALSKNPDLKTIPCHRVVRSDGKVGGYRYGMEHKQKLLLIVVLATIVFVLDGSWLLQAGLKPCRLG